MVEVVERTIYIPFEFIADGIPNGVFVCGEAEVSYVAEREGRYEPWYIEEFSFGEIEVKESTNEDGDSVDLTDQDMDKVRDQINRQEYLPIVERCLDDAREYAAGY